jgi:hypothetical protein
MLKDLGDSKRLDAYVHSESKKNPSQGQVLTLGTLTAIFVHLDMIVTPYVCLIISPLLISLHVHVYLKNYKSCWERALLLSNTQHS